MLKALSIIAFIALAGCSGPREVVRYEPMEVLVPVAVPCPHPPPIERPVLPLARIDQASTPDQVMRAYVSSTYLLMGYAAQLEELLRAYRQPTHPPLKSSE